MNIRMAGIDYSLAGIDIREKFSLTESCLKGVYEFLEGREEILGAVVITTCNRTELYLSCAEGYEENPFALLCEALGLDFGEYRFLHRMREGRELFWHLCLLSCGTKSQIWGEDQIISQVKRSITKAREYKAADSYLEVLFRSAVTAAKRIKTEIKFSKSENSVADKTLALLSGKLSRPAKVLVIGNGEIGRLAATVLTEGGYEVWMTLRQYKYGLIEVPEGVRTLEYGERYRRMPEFSAVVSATLSPHYTTEAEPFSQLSRKPEILVDLAVPRDIDPAIGRLEGISVYDVDTLAGDSIRENHERLLSEMDVYIQKQYDDFQKWSQYKESVAV